ncbi:CYTH domain-containing protein [Pedobacter sp. Leaf194]|uniref:CYTH domain-containing protein n=1 Tax=Pedobacter sp. Leaf194 TaxID=1736297 RepID=UPI0007026D77|nr:CYTH domain-containing protein [Pedobacter sp. Leaf194]KQS41608.1 adenylate cyclase [Pedobacter sp. Leaf194]
MPKEIERKFLLNASEWQKLNKPPGKKLRQGYILTDPNKTIRIRTAEDKAWMTIKGISVGATRLEFEYEIPQNEATELLDNFSENELEKTRYEIVHRGKLWEVDVFSGDNEGLIVAEIELEAEDEQFEFPDWISDEVTHEKKYYNSNLCKNPFKNWN